MDSRSIYSLISRDHIICYKLYSCSRPYSPRLKPPTTKKKTTCNKLETSLFTFRHTPAIKSQPVRSACLEWRIYAAMNDLLMAPPCCWRWAFGRFRLLDVILDTWRDWIEWAVSLPSDLAVRLFRGRFLDTFLKTRRAVKFQYPEVYSKLGGENASPVLLL